MWGRTMKNPELDFIDHSALHHSAPLNLTLEAAAPTICYPHVIESYGH